MAGTTRSRRIAQRLDQCPVSPCPGADHLPCRQSRGDRALPGQESALHPPILARQLSGTTRADQPLQPALGTAQLTSCRFRFIEAVSLQDGWNRANVAEEVAPPDVGEALAQLRPRELTLAVRGLGTATGAADGPLHAAVEPREGRATQHDTRAVIGQPEIGHRRHDAGRCVVFAEHHLMAGGLLLVQWQAPLGECLLRECVEGEGRCVPRWQRDQDVVAVAAKKPPSVSISAATHRSNSSM